MGVSNTLPFLESKAQEPANDNNVGGNIQLKYGMGYGRYFKLVHGGLPYGNPRELWNIAILIAI